MVERLTPTQDPAELPEELRGRYQVIGPLGEGAFGRVLRCRDRQLGREVAIKLLRTGGRPEVVKRFEVEAALLARLKHPGVVELYDHGTTAQGPYLVLELVEGESLEHAQVVDPVALMLAVGAGLEAIHDAKLVHRDLKPANILVRPDGRPVLLDLGLAFDAERTRMTATGARVGTVAYMAPEILRGERAAPACDWYAWGVTLFELLEGRPPYGSQELLATFQGRPLSPLQFSRLDPQAPPAWLLTLLLEEPADRRPASLAEVRAVLDGSAARRPGARSAALPAAGVSASSHLAAPRRRVGLGAGLVAVGLALAWGLFGRGGAPTPVGQGGGAPAAGPRQQAVEEALERLIGPHRHPDGRLLVGVREGVIEEHLAEVLREVADGRLAPRLRRLLEALEDWLGEASPEAVEAFLTERCGPALLHLSGDEVLLHVRLAYSDAYSQVWGTMRPVPFDAEVVRARLAEQEELRSLMLPRLRARLGGTTTGLELLGAMGTRLPAPERARLRDELLAACDASADTARQARLLNGAGLLLPGPLEDGEGTLCDDRAGVLRRVHARLGQPRGAVPMPTWAVFAAGSAFDQFHHLLECRTELGEGDLADWRRALDVTQAALDEDFEDAYGSVLLNLQAIIVFHRMGGFVLTGFGPEFRAVMDRIEAMVDGIRERRGVPAFRPFGKRADGVSVLLGQ